MQAKPLRTEVAPYVFEHEPMNLCELERYCWITPPRYQVTVRNSHTSTEIRENVNVDEVVQSIAREKEETRISLA